MAPSDSGGGHEARRSGRAEDERARSRVGEPQPGIAVDDAWAPERFLKARRRRPGRRGVAAGAALLCAFALATVILASGTSRDDERPGALAGAPSGERGVRSASAAAARPTAERTESRPSARKRRAAKAARAASSARASLAARRRSRAAAAAPPAAAPRPAARPAAAPPPAAPQPAAAPPAAAPPPASASIPCEFPPC